MLTEDAPVRLTNAQLEEPDYRKLYAAYSSGGRKSVTDAVDPGNYTIMVNVKNTTTGAIIIRAKKIVWAHMGLSHYGHL